MVGLLGCTGSWRIGLGLSAPMILRGPGAAEPNIDAMLIHRDRTVRASLSDPHTLFDPP
jgi:hypothetical protein